MIRQRFHIGWVAAALVAVSAIGFAQSVQDNLWVTNGPVEAIERSGNTIYIGGSFSLVGPSTGFGAAINLTTAQYDPAMPKVNGFIYAVEPDGAGGWFIGGLFTAVGGTSRKNIAHIRPDKTVDPAWAPDADDAVYAITRSGSTLYVGGLFANIANQPRSRIAALSTTNGSAASWDPGASGNVLALAVVNSFVYAGGEFADIGGSQSQYFAALDISSGNAAPLNLVFNNVVSSISVATIVGAGTSLFIGGAFTDISGQTRSQLAQIALPGHSLTTWQPAANAYVRDVKFDGSLVYVGGDFTSISSSPRSYVASIDLGGKLTNWNPSVDYLVTRVAVVGQTVYIGGAFTSVGGQTRIGLAGIDATTGNATTWRPDVNYPVLALAIDGNTMYAGGFFTSVNNVQRNHLAALDATTGVPTSWNPGANNVVRDILTIGSTVYVCGDFDSLGGAIRYLVGAVNAGNGSVTGWDPLFSGNQVYAMATSGNNLYCGGNFEAVGQTPWNNLAAVNLTTGLVDPAWYSETNGPVTTVAIDGQNVYIGGLFNQVLTGSQAGDFTRMYVADIDLGTGTPTTWDPVADNWVRSIVVSGGRVFAGGSFSTIGGQASPALAAIDAATGSPVGLNLDVGGAFSNGQTSIAALALSGNTLFAGGDFTNVLSFQRRGIFSVDVSTENVTPFDPGTDQPVSSLFIDGTTVYVGGSFFFIAGQVRTGFAGLFDPTLTTDITVVSPNGGESWTVGSTQTIQWNSSGISGNVRIELSRDNGSSYSDIVSSTGNSGSYNWDVTGPATTQALVRVSSVSGPAVSDNSDAVFAIGSPSITVISPNGGESWSVGSTRTIRWNSFGISGNVRIELSPDNGSSFSDIVSSTGNSGSYNWMVTGPATTQSLVRVSSISTPAISDNSDAIFSIVAPSIAIPDSVVFQPVELGMSYQDSIVVTNVGSDTLRLFSIVSDNPVFSVSPDSGSVAPLASLILHVVFTPTQIGPTYGGIIFTHNVGGGRDTVGVSGTGVGAGFTGISINPSSFDFNETYIGDRPTTNIQMQNSGNRNLVVDSIRIQGGSEFAVQSGTGPFNPLPPQGIITVTVLFAPLSEGARNASVRIYSNAPTSPDSVTLSGIGIQPPIQPVLAGDTLAGNSLGINVTLPPGFIVAADTLFYRNGGETQFRRENFVQTGDTLTASFPDSVMNIRGVEYYIELTTSSGSPVTFPVSNPATNPSIVRVRVNDYGSPKTIPGGKYTMVSVPLELDDRSPAGLFFDDLGDYKKNVWRLFRWNGVENIEYPNITAQFAQGNAFWLITHATRSFDTGGGLSTNSARPYLITLEPGWNQIANPFAFPVSWDSIAAAGLVGPYAFDGVEFQAGSPVLMPWEGYFVRNDLSAPLAIFIPALEAVVPKTPPSAPREYRIQITAEVPGTPYRDSQNYCGFVSASQDYPDPPMIDDHLNVSLLEDGLPYMTSFRAPGGAGERWDLAISSSLPRADVRMVLSELGERPHGLSVSVVNRDNESVVALANNSFSVSLDGPGDVRTLSILVGTDEYLKSALQGVSLEPARYRLYPNYPNPFNPTTTITYQLEKRGVVELGIYNVLGQRIRSLVSGEEAAGAHSVTWNGMNDSGSDVSSGLYFYVLRAGDFIEGRKLVLMR